MPISTMIALVVTMVATAFLSGIFGMAGGNGSGMPLLWMMSVRTRGSRATCSACMPPQLHPE